MRLPGAWKGSSRQPRLTYILVLMDSYRATMDTDDLDLEPAGMEPEEQAAEQIEEQLTADTSSQGTFAQDIGDPLLAGFLTRQLSVSKKQWQKITQTQDDPDAYNIKHSALARRLVRGLGVTRKGLATKATLSTLRQVEAGSGGGRASRFSRRSICMLPVMSPRHRLAVWQSIVLTILDGTYSAFVVPISIAFEVNLSVWSWVTILDMIAMVLFTADILLLFHTGFVISYNLKKKLILSGPAVARYYICHGSFIFDAVSTVPLWMEFIILVAFNNNAPPLLIKILVFLRLCRILRLCRFVKNMFASSGGQLGKRLNRWVSSTLLYFLNIVYAAAALINFLGCLWYWVARREGVDNSWLISVGGKDLTGDGPVRQYVASVYFAMTTVTTVGYGDIIAQSAVEEITAMIIMLCGVLFFGILIGSLGEIVSTASHNARRAQLFRNKFEDVDSWMRQRKLPKRTRKKIHAYYSEVWVRQAEWHDDKLFEELPSSISGEVASFLTREVFEQSDVFSNLHETAKSRLASRLKPIMIPPGHDLCHEGDPADCLWILQEGEVLAMSHTQQMELLPAPAVIGEAVILSSTFPEAAIRSCTFRALGSCIIWQLKLSDIQPLLNVYPELMQNMVASLEKRLMARAHFNPEDAERARLLQHVAALKQTSLHRVHRQTADAASAHRSGSLPSLDKWRRATDNPRMARAGSLTTISISAGAGPVSSPPSGSAATEQLSPLSPRGTAPLLPLGTPTHSDQNLTAPVRQSPAGQHATTQTSIQQHSLPGSTPPLQPEPHDISVQMESAGSMQDLSSAVESAAAAVPPADSAAGVPSNSSAAGGLISMPDPATSSSSDDSTAAVVEGQQWRPTRRKAPSGGQAPEIARQISHSSDFSIRVPDSWLAAVFAGKLLARQRQGHTSGSQQQQPPQNRDA